MKSDVPSDDEVFGEALRRPLGKDRDDYLNEVCGDDSALRQRIEKLLAAYAQANSFLEPQTELALPPEVDRERDLTGTRIGSYDLIRVLGQGGMGVVYVAEQKHPVHRRVALKVIRPGMDSARVIARFETERQTLAMMDHPNIAKVLDAGQTDSDRPYFVMELVDGLSITRYCARERLGIPDRLRIFVDVCRGVQHAHQKGIIHRDLKPSNILVGVHDGKPIPKVIDFGVAKATESTTNASLGLTQVGQIVGTIEYMSPEQASRKHDVIDTRSDIYSLGVILYELLTGAPPFESRQLQSAGLDEMLRIIGQTDPPSPSLRVLSSKSRSGDAKSLPLDPEKLGRVLRGELDWIALKAIEKDPSRRYETASQFAEDIENYLSDRPVLACPPSLGYRVRKVVRRNRWSIAVAAAILFVLMTGIVGTTYQAIRASVAEQDAIQSYEKEQAARQDAEIAKKLVEEEAEKSRRQVIQLQVSRGNTELDSDNLMGALPWFASALKMDAGTQRERMHRLRLTNALKQCPKLSALVSHDQPVSQAVLSPAGGKFATASFDGVVRIWDLRGEPLSSPLAHDAAVVGLDFSRDGELLAVAFGASVQIWQSSSGKPSGPPFQQQHPVEHLQFSPDGKHLITGARNPQAQSFVARVWNLQSGEATGRDCVHMPRQSRDGDLISALQVSNNGARFLTVSPFDRDVLIWDVEAVDKEPLRIATHHPGIQYACFNRSGTKVLTCGGDGTARLWDTEDGRPVSPRLPHDHLVQWGCFTPDDRSAITASFDQNVRVWDVDKGQLRFPPVKCSAAIDRVEVSPDGFSFVGSARDGTAQVRTTGSGELLCASLKHESTPGGIAFDPEGRFLLAFTSECARVWDLAGSHHWDAVLTHAGRPDHCRPIFGPNRKLVTIQPPVFGVPCSSCAAQIWDVESFQPSGPRVHQSMTINDASFSPDESMLATASEDGSVCVWDTRDGTMITQKLMHGAPVNIVTWHPGGRLIATACGDQQAMIWTIPEGKQLAALAHNGRIQSLSFSPDGKWLATGAFAARLWDVESGQPLSERFHGGGIRRLKFIDHNRLFVTSFQKDRGSAVWEFSPTRQRSERALHSLQQASGDITPDGRMFVTGGYDGSARLWDGNGNDILATMRHKNAVWEVQLLWNGELTLTVSADKTARLWETRSGIPVSPALRLLTNRIRRSAVHHPSRDLIAIDGLGATVFRITTDGRPVGDLVSLTELLGLQRIDDEGEIVDLDYPRVLEIYQDLRSKFPDSFQATEPEIETWRLARAREAYADNNLQACADIWDRVLASDPERSDYLLARGCVASDQGDAQTAVETLEQCAAQRFGQENALLILSELYVSVSEGVRDLEKALHCAQRLLELTPGDPTALRSYAFIQYYRGEYQEALDKLNRTLELEPNGSAYNTRAAVLSSLGRRDEALEDFKRSQQFAIDNYAVHLNYSRLLRFVGQLGEAKNAIELAVSATSTAVKESPDDVALRLQLIELWGELVNLHEQLGETQEASELRRVRMEQAQAVELEHPDLADRVSPLIEIDRYNEAMELINQGRATDDVAKSLGEIVERFEHLPIQRPPDFVALVHSQYGQMLKHRDPDTSRKHLETAVSILSQLNEDRHLPVLSLTEFKLADVLHGREREETVLDWYRKSIQHAEQWAKIQPDPSAFAALASLLVECKIESLRDPIRAQAICEQVLTSIPNHPQAKRACGIACFYLEAWDQVVKYLHGSKETHDYLMLSIAEARRGNWEVSERNWHIGWLKQDTSCVLCSELLSQAKQLLDSQVPPPKADQEKPTGDDPTEPSADLRESSGQSLAVP